MGKIVGLNGKTLEDASFFAHATLEAEEEKGTDGEEIRSISGYASTKDLDRYDDIIEPSAFARSLDMFMKNPVLFYNHNWHMPIGRVVEGMIDDNGLKVKARLNDASETARMVWDLIKLGDLRAFSFAFRILNKQEAGEGESPDVVNVDGHPRVVKRRITDLDLFEVSVVSVPANGRALFSLAKGLMFGSDIFERTITPADLASFEHLMPYEAKSNDCTFGHNHYDWSRSGKKGSGGADSEMLRSVLRHLIDLREFQGAQCQRLKEAEERWGGKIDTVLKILNKKSGIPHDAREASNGNGTSLESKVVTELRGIEALLSKER